MDSMELVMDCMCMVMWSAMDMKNCLVNALEVYILISLATQMVVLLCYVKTVSN